MNNFLKKSFKRYAPKVGLSLMFMAIIVGAVTGLAAVFFIHLITIIQNFSYSSAANFLPVIGNFAYVLVPVLGALLVGPLIAYFAAEAKGHGVPEVMQAIIIHGGRIDQE